MWPAPNDTALPQALRLFRRFGLQEGHTQGVWNRTCVLRHRVGWLAQDDVHSYLVPIAQQCTAHLLPGLGLGQ
jgi:hypothetical protein